MTDVAAPTKLTPARRRALLVLMDRHDVGRSALTSTATDVAEGHVNANAAAGLVEGGLAATVTNLPGCRYVRITEAGVEALQSEYGDGGWRVELAALRASLRNGGR